MSGVAAAAWTPPNPNMPIKMSALQRVLGASAQSRVDMQMCFCPCCPPPPDKAKHIAQRKNFQTHFKTKHSEYTFLTGATAAAVGNHPLGFLPAPRAGALLLAVNNLFLSFSTEIMYFSIL